MGNERFKRYLLDGGFWFDEYVEPVWAITDTENRNSSINYLEFKDEYKDLCDKVVIELNRFNDENQELISSVYQHMQYLDEYEQKVTETLQKYFKKYTWMAMELRHDKYGNSVCHDVVEVLLEISDDLGVDLE